MYIVGVADNAYVQHLAVMFASLLINHKGAMPEIFVIGDTLHDENKTRMRETINRFGAALHFLQGDGFLSEKFRVSRHITRAAYLKIFIPELLPAEIDKVIYLDCDIVVEIDIAQLWNMDIGGHYLAAVPDCILNNRLRDLCGKEGLPYFNSGVMLMNLRKWRKDKIAAKTLTYIEQYNEKLLYHDQDALNAVVQGRWLVLDERFNLQTPFLPNDISTGRDDALRCGAVNGRMIIHYTGRGKPWQPFSPHPFRDHYYKYLRHTAWNSFNPKWTLRNILDGTGLIMKRLAPSLVKRLRSFLILKALHGSRICRWLCRHLHIELNVEPN